MRKFSLKLLIVIILIVIANLVIVIHESYADTLSVNCPSSVEVNGKITVRVNLSPNTEGFDCTVTASPANLVNKGSDGIVYYNAAGMNQDSPAEFTAVAAGNVTLSFSAITYKHDGSVDTNVNIEPVTVKINNPAPEPPPQPQKTLTGISVKTVPNKVKYNEGETFDKSGMVINATYSDGSNKDVTGYTYSPSGKLKPSDTKITIKYTEGSVTKEATQAITVTASQPQQNTSTNTTNTYTNTTNTSNTANNKVNNTNTNTNTTVVNPTFKEVNENVYAVKNCNVRSSCSTSANNKIGSLMQGELVVRTGYSTEWSRIKYNGQTAYVATNLLTTEEPEDDEEVNNVTNELENNTVDDELLELKEEIGVLPEVGNPVAVKIFFIISAISTACVSGLLYYKKNG